MEQPDRPWEQTLPLSWFTRLRHAFAQCFSYARAAPRIRVRRPHGDGPARVAEITPGSRDYAMLSPRIETEENLIRRAELTRRLPQIRTPLLAATNHQATTQRGAKATHRQIIASPSFSGRCKSESAILKSLRTMLSVCLANRSSLIAKARRQELAVYPRVDLAPSCMSLPLTCWLTGHKYWALFQPLDSSELGRIVSSAML
jgi:hypothetical protein